VVLRRIPGRIDDTQERSSTAVYLIRPFDDRSRQPKVPRRWTSILLRWPIGGRGGFEKGFLCILYSQSFLLLQVSHYRSWIPAMNRSTLGHAPLPTPFPPQGEVICAAMNSMVRTRVNRVPKCSHFSSFLQPRAPDQFLLSRIMTTSSKVATSCDFCLRNYVRSNES